MAKKQNKQELVVDEITTADELGAVDVVEEANATVEDIVVPAGDETITEETCEVVAPTEEGAAVTEVMSTDDEVAAINEIPAVGEELYEATSVVKEMPALEEAASAEEESSTDQPDVVVVDAAPATAIIEEVAPLTETPAEEEEPEAIPSEVEAETGYIEEIPGAPGFQTPAELKAAIEVLLFTTPYPLGVQKLCNVLGKIDRKTLRGSVSQLQMEYDARNGGLQIIESPEGFRMCTRPAYADVVLRMHQQRKRNPLSMTALETLAIIAYKQPLTRAEIEMIRGVESSGVVRNLMDMDLVKVVGRKEIIGRPQLYGTTVKFLNMFGLNSTAELPSIQSLRRDFSGNAANVLDQMAAAAAGEDAKEEAADSAEVTADVAAIAAEQAPSTDTVEVSETVADEQTVQDNSQETQSADLSEVTDLSNGNVASDSDVVAASETKEEPNEVSDESVASVEEPVPDSDDSELIPIEPDDASFNRDGGQV